MYYYKFEFEDYNEGIYLMLVHEEKLETESVNFMFFMAYEKAAALQREESEKSYKDWYESASEKDRKEFGNLDYSTVEWFSSSLLEETAEIMCKNFGFKHVQPTYKLCVSNLMYSEGKWKNVKNIQEKIYFENRDPEEEFVYCRY